MTRISILLLLFLSGLPVQAQKPVADFEIVINYSCYQASIELKNTSKNAHTYLWDYHGRGEFVERYEPVGSNVGSNSGWMATLIAIGKDGRDTVSKYINVEFSRLDAAYELMDSNIYAPTKAVFYNKSEAKEGDTLQYMWIFGVADTLYGDTVMYDMPEARCYLARLISTDQNDCQRFYEIALRVKDTAETGSFDFLIPECYPDSMETPCGFNKHFKIEHDTLYASGYYYSDCLPDKKVTVRYKKDTVEFKTWKTWCYSTLCLCGYCFEIAVPYAGDPNPVVVFDNEIYQIESGDTKITEPCRHPVNVYPNPARDIIFVKSEDVLKEVAIYDINGTINGISHIQDAFLNRIDVSHLPQGFYFLKVRTGRKTYIRKVTIE